MEYGIPDCPGQMLEEPTIDPAAAGSGLTVIIKGTEAAPSPQEFVPLTVRAPDVEVGEKSMVIEFVVPLIVAPVPE